MWESGEVMVDFLCINETNIVSFNRKRKRGEKSIIFKEKRWPQAFLPAWELRPTVLHSLYWLVPPGQEVPGSESWTDVVTGENPGLSQHGAAFKAECFQTDFPPIASDVHTWSRLFSTLESDHHRPNFCGRHQILVNFLQWPQFEQGESTSSRWMY